MKLLHHSQGYSQMYILYSETGPPISVTVVQVGSALFRLAREREVCRPVMKSRAERHGDECTTAFLTPEGAVALQALQLCFGSHFLSKNFPPCLEDAGRNMNQWERTRTSLYLRSQSHIIIIITVLHWYYAPAVAASICCSQLAVTSFQQKALNGARDHIFARQKKHLQFACPHNGSFLAIFTSHLNQKGAQY